MRVLESQIVSTGQGHQKAEADARKTIEELSMSVALHRAQNESHQKEIRTLLTLAVTVLNPNRNVTVTVSP